MQPSEFANPNPYESQAERLDEQYSANGSLHEQFRRFCGDLGFGSLVLDAGCAGAHLSGCSGASQVAYCGVDTSRAMVSIARRRVAMPQSVRRADVRSLPWPSGSFDGVWCTAVLHHLSLSDMEQALGEMARVIKWGGLLQFSIPIVIEEGAGDTIQASSARTVRSLEPTLQKSQLRLEKIHTERVLGVVSNYSDWVMVRCSKAGTENSDDDCALCPSTGWPRVHKHCGLWGIFDVYGSGGVYLVPDVAPITEGHFLVCSDDHRLSFATPSDARAAAINSVRAWADFLLAANPHWDDFMIAEHAPPCKGERGRCVDHAHLHFVPLTSKQLESVRAVLFRHDEHITPQERGGLFLSCLRSGGARLQREQLGVSQALRRAFHLIGVTAADTWQTTVLTDANAELYRATASQLHRANCHLEEVHGA